MPWRCHTLRCHAIPRCLLFLVLQLQKKTVFRSSFSLIRGCSLSRGVCTRSYHVSLHLSAPTRNAYDRTCLACCVANSCLYERSRAKFTPSFPRLLGTWYDRGGQNESYLLIYCALLPMNGILCIFCIPVMLLGLLARVSFSRNSDPVPMAK